MLPNRPVERRRSEFRRLPTHDLSTTTLGEKGRNRCNGSLFALIIAICPTAFAAITPTGDVIPTPVPPVVAGTVIVGNTATGTLTVDTGSTLTAGGFSLGNNAAPANGTVSIIGTTSGPQTTLNLLGPASSATSLPSPLQLGRWGVGSLTVSNGAIMNVGMSGGSPSTTCLQSNNCNVFIGASGGATGTLTLTGALTTANVAGGLNIGEAFVGSVAHGGFDLGTPGQNASGTIQILNGATLNSTFAQLGIVPTGFAEAGTEHATGHVVVDGTGSAWNIAANAVSGAPANLTIGRDVRGTGIVEVTNNAHLTLAGTNSFVSVGERGIGTLTINSGGTLTTQSLSVANGATGNGVVDIVGTTSGPQTVINLSGPPNSSTGNNPLQVGNWGNGTMTVSNGAIVNSAVGNPNCGIVFCGNYVGNGAGSTALLELRDAGTTANLAGSFIVGNASVFTNPPNSFVFGTPGGSTDATVRVLNGATLNTYDATISSGPGGSNPLGTEHTTAHVTIDGVGSVWQVTSNPNNNAQAFVGVAPKANATAVIDITNGGQLVITGSGSLPQPQMNLTGSGAQAGGSSTLNVSGIGSNLVASAVVFNGDSGVIQLGRNGGTAALNITNGGQVYGGGANGLTSMNVGRTDSHATLTVDGVGSALTLSGVTTAASGTAGIGAGMSIGRETGGIGTVAVTNGGAILIKDGGQNATASGVGMLLGRDAGASGSLTVSGTGSKVTIEQTGSGSSTVSPGMTIGSTGSGQLVVNGGGTILIHDNGSLAAGGGAGITVATNTGSSGSITVSGVGSSITVDQTGAGTRNPGITVGRAGTGQMLVTDGATVAVNGNVQRNFIVGNTGIGTLTVSNGAEISASWFGVGINAGGTGTATIDNAAVRIDGFAVSLDSTVFGGSVRVGRGVGATGTLNLVNGAQITLNTSIANSSVNLGGTGDVNFGNGTLNMSGGSSISFIGTSATPSVNIGHSGSGLFTMSGASSLNLPSDGTIYIGKTSTGIGTLTMASGSSIQTGNVNVGASGTGGMGMVGATLNVAGNLIVGDAGTGTMSQSGGTNTIGGQLIIGNQASGNGNYQASNAASIVLTGTSTTARVLVGNAGTGALTLESGSTMSLASGGSMIVGATATGSGNVFVDSSSSIQAGTLIGLGHDGTVSTGGQGKLIVDGSVTANNLVIGANGCLAGNGIVHANVVMNGVTGSIGACPPAPPPPVLITATGAPGITPFGIINAGRSPGRLVIDGGFDFISGTIVLEVESDGHGGFLVDQLVFRNTVPIDLTSANIEFSFLGLTDPNAFEASGLWKLDTFFKVNPDTGGTFNPSGDVGISAIVPQGETLDDLFAQATFGATSTAFVIENFTFTPDAGVAPGFEATPIGSSTVPEPAPWMLLLAAMLVLYAARIRRLAAIAPRR
jgi:T5SS/PEP-CTERM-associated repeat protein